MTVTFISNFLNHHQTPVANQLYRKIGDNYRFISTEPTPETFLKSGYPNCENYQYNLLSYENESNYNKALKLVVDSDILIIGGCNVPEFLNLRLSSGKPLIRYTERWHKKVKSYFFLPYHILNGNVWRNHISLRNKPVYLLCAGAFVKDDCNLIGAYPNKRFKWGYFTNVNKLDIEKIINEKKNQKPRILWISRFIDWKHPELPVILASQLKKKGYDFQIDMIGTGPLVDRIQKLINKLEVSNFVNLLGTMPNHEVTEELKRSHIFLFTSDRQEGWGAVLNEAMSNGCTVVASDLIGSVPFLLNEENTGLIFKSGNLKSLQSKVEKLLNNTELSSQMARNAYNVIFNMWSPENAANNLLQLCDSIVKEDLNTLKIEQGPCSKL